MIRWRSYTLLRGRHATHLDALEMPDTAGGGGATEGERAPQRRRAELRAESAKSRKRAFSSPILFVARRGNSCFARFVLCL